MYTGGWLYTCSEQVRHHQRKHALEDEAWTMTNTNKYCSKYGYVCVKNITTRRCGYTAQFLAFGYDPKPVFQVNLQDLLVPGEGPASWQRQRIQLRQAATSALYDLKTRSSLSEALTRSIQSTDKSPFRAGDLVDYWVVPDSKAKGSSHWAGPCRVIGRGGNGTTNKSWVICRPARTTTSISSCNLVTISVCESVTCFIWLS